MACQGVLGKSVGWEYAMLTVLSHAFHVLQRLFELCVHVPFALFHCKQTTNIENAQAHREN